MLATKATLVIVPGHLMGQWPSEVNKFLSLKKKVVAIKDLVDMNKLTVNDVLSADIVIVSFSIFTSDKYFARLARFCGIDPNIVQNSSGRHFEALHSDCLKRLPQRTEEVAKSCSNAYSLICEQANENAQNADHVVRMDSKKAAYANKSPAKKKAPKLPPAEGDPWELTKTKTYTKMKCPPLEMFYFYRIVVDE